MEEVNNMDTDIITLIGVISFTIIALSAILFALSMQHEEMMEMCKTDYGKCMGFCSERSTNFDTFGCFDSCQKLVIGGD